MFANKEHEKAHVLFKDGKLKESILIFTKALVAAPNHLDILSDRGVAYLHLKEEQKCFDDLNLAIELQPEYGFRYACRAFAKRSFGAEQRFKRADKLSKQEDQLLGVINQIDQKENSENKNVLPLHQEKEPIDPRPTKSNEFKKIFTSIKQFKEFMHFMRNGFRINKK